MLVLGLLSCLAWAGAKKGSAEKEESVDWTSSLSLEDLSTRCAAGTTIAVEIKQAFSKCSKFSRPQTRLSRKGKKGKGKGKVNLRLIYYFLLIIMKGKGKGKGSKKCFTVEELMEKFEAMSQSKS